MNNDYPEELMQFLSESPLGQGETEGEPPVDLLWALKWGLVSPSHPSDIGTTAEAGRGGETAVQPARLQLLEEIVQSFRRTKSPYNIMVSAEYGTGKTSLLRRLKNRLDMAEEEGQFQTLWLDMPSLTGTTPALTHALVMAAIVNKLAGEGYGTVNPEWQTHVREIWELDKAMYAHTNGQSSPCAFDTAKKPPPDNTQKECREEPRRSSLPGATTPERVLQAVQLEQGIKELLKGNFPHPRHLVVFLDDLDRCQKFVPYHVIRLLLRFGGVERVHFVLACDEEIMAVGAKQWMECHGHGFGDKAGSETRNGTQTAYSPASALRKYIALQVNLPGMGDAVANAQQDLVDQIERDAPSHAQNIRRLLHAYADRYVSNHPDCPPSLREELQSYDPGRNSSGLVKLLGNNYFTLFLAVMLGHITEEDLKNKSSDRRHDNLRQES
ncbi:MAG: AAA family ATPase [Magnetococcales bacterium]|nr:AAA family ATPase [Magnetococcales bacterium]